MRALFKWGGLPVVNAPGKKLLDTGTECQSCAASHCGGGRVVAHLQATLSTICWVNAKLLGWLIAGLVVAVVVFLAQAPNGAIDQAAGPAMPTVPSPLSR